MTSPNLENLVRAGELQAEPPAKLEFDGLVASALSYLNDARKPSLAIVSRFNLAYPREVVKRALHHNCGAIILAHNPPQEYARQGDYATPSTITA